jgi:hypothetical protein
VIVRPDHYVFDVCSTLAELEAALAELARWLGHGR